MDLYMEEAGVKIYYAPCSKTCGNGMEKISRKMGDVMLTKLSLGVIKVKRYLCFVCLRERRRYTI